MADSEALLRRHVSLSLDLLCSLGISVNLKKSHLIPAQVLQFIGALLDSVQARAFLPQDRAAAIWYWVHQVQQHRSSRALTIQRLLGHMAAAIPVVPFAKMHMRLLQAEFLRQFKPHRHLPSSSCVEILFFIIIDARNSKMICLKSHSLALKMI